MKTVLILSLLFLVSCSPSGGSPVYGGPAGIGNGAGAVVAGLPSSSDETKEDRILQQQEILRKQELEKERQKREVEDLRRQEFHNERLREYQGN